jgi:UDP-N-acetylmuramoylalanine--D-glutamate ligase
LELSSWQLADLQNQPLWKPRIALITAIMSDHQNWYSDMKSYTDDKRNIYKFQDKNCTTIAADDNEWGRSFLAETPAKALPYNAQSAGRFWDCPVAAPGEHNKVNLFAAALALAEAGLDLEYSKKHLSLFPGIEHRLEYFYESRNGVSFYNDTAATIPEAAAAAAASFETPVLVCGGTDKNLDFTVLAEAAKKAGGVVILRGSGTQKLLPLLEERQIKYHGPFDNLPDVINAALACCAAANSKTVLFSPGCASFELFKNEFDRGQKWKAAVRSFA